MATKRINGCNVSHIDNETGEVICTTDGCIEIKDYLLSEKEKRKKDYLETHVMDFNKNEDFVKMFTEAVYVLSLILKPTEYIFAMRLAKYVSYEECALKIGYGSGSHYMTMREIANEMHKDYTRTSKILSTLIKKGIIGVVKVGNRNNETITEAYIVNPYIYINGKNPSKEVCKFFADSGWKEIYDEMKTEIYNYKE